MKYIFFLKQVPEETAEILKRNNFVWEYRGVTKVKGKPPMKTYFITGSTSTLSEPMKIEQVNLELNQNRSTTTNQVGTSYHVSKQTDIQGSENSEMEVDHIDVNELTVKETSTAISEEIDNLTKQLHTESADPVRLEYCSNCSIDKINETLTDAEDQKNR